MSNSVEIRTNNVPRSLMYGYELPEKARAEFDYLSDDEFETREFIKYKGRYYDLGEFMRIDESRLPAESHLNGWDGYVSDSFFSGVLLKYTDKYCESVVMGWYCS